MNRITFEIVWPILIVEYYVSGWLTGRKKKLLKVLGILMIPVTLVLAQIYVWYPLIGWPETGIDWAYSIICGPIMTCISALIPVGIFIGMLKLIRWVLKEGE